MDPRAGDDDDMFGDAAFPQDLGPSQDFENESSDSEEEFPRTRKCARGEASTSREEEGTRDGEKSSSSWGSLGRAGKLLAGGPLREANLDDLSEDLLLKVFGLAHLSVKELCAYALVSRKFKRVAYTPSLWGRVTLGRDVNNCTLHKIAKRCSSLTELRIEKVQKIHGLRSVFRACGHSLKRLKISWESNSGSGFAFLVLWMVSRDCRELDSVELTSTARSTYSMGLEYGPIWCLTVGCPSMRTFIDFCGRSTTDNTLNLIGRAWKDLTTLAIHGVMFTMRGLIQLRGCTKLQSLEICDGKLGLIAEAHEPRQQGFMLHDTLERLTFNRTPVTTDEVTSLLRACPALKRVEVKGLSHAVTGVGEEAKDEMKAVKKRIADFGALNELPAFKARGFVVYAE